MRAKRRESLREDQANRRSATRPAPDAVQGTANGGNKRAEVTAQRFAGAAPVRPVTDPVDVAMRGFATVDSGSRRCRRVVRHDVETCLRSRTSEQPSRVADSDGLISAAGLATRCAAALAVHYFAGVATQADRVARARQHSIPFTQNVGRQSRPSCRVRWTW